MLSITAAFGMVMALLGLFVLCVFSALIIGAYVHHRGVVVGSGNRESFTGVVPKGDVFRIPDAGSLPDEPEDHDPVTALTQAATLNP